MALSGVVNKTGIVSNDRIYLRFEWSATQSVTGNYSTVSWYLYLVSDGSQWGVIYADTPAAWIVTVDGTRYDGTAALGLSVGQKKLLGSGSTRVNHNADGSKTFSFAFTQYFNIYWSGSLLGSHGGSGTGTLNKIPRAATFTAAPNFTDEENPTISYSNSAGSAVTSLQACIASSDGVTAYAAYREIPRDGSSYTFQLTDAEREAMRKACTTANSMTVAFYLKTVLGGETYRNFAHKTLTIANAQPTLSPTVKDVDDGTLRLTGSSAKIVRYHSDAAYTVGAAAKKHATIVSQRVTCGGKSGAAASGTLSNVESGSFAFQAIDSRGNTVTKTVMLQLVEYVHLSCAMEVSTPTADGKCTLRAFGNAFNGSFGAAANELIVEYHMSADGGSTWDDWVAVQPTKSGNGYDATANITGLDYRTAYTFEARARDALEIATTERKTVKAFPLFDWGEDGFSFNVPVLADAGVEVNGGLIVDGVPIGAHKELWGGGAYHMIGSHTIQLAEAVSEQAHGIVLVWGAYSGGTAYNYDWCYQFIPKHHVSKQNGTGVSCVMATAGFGYVGSKYVYVSDTSIQGNDKNNATGSSNGITYNNGYWVLRYVIGV